jgi:hypothetical protein
MSLDTKREAGLARVQKQLCSAKAVTPDLMADVIVRARLRFTERPHASRTRIVRLLECGALTDAMFALLEVELPEWKLRRLVYEDGEWICSLSKHRELPDWLDDTAEARHETLALAIAAALLEAQSRAAGAERVSVPTVPQEPRATDCALCCDNFA